MPSALRGAGRHLDLHLRPIPLTWTYTFPLTFDVCPLTVDLRLTYVDASGQ